jgi:hypothetical protein
LLVSCKPSMLSFLGHQVQKPILKHPSCWSSANHHCHHSRFSDVQTTYPSFWSS